MVNTSADVSSNAMEDEIFICLPSLPTRVPFFYIVYTLSTLYRWCLFVVLMLQVHLNLFIKSTLFLCYGSLIFSSLLFYQCTLLLLNITLFCLTPWISATLAHCSLVIVTLSSFACHYSSAISHASHSSL